MTKIRWPIPGHWRWSTIGEIGEVIGGGTPSARRASNFSQHGGHAWVTPADMSAYSETYIRRGRRNLSAEGLAASGARLLPPLTVIFSSRAPIGYCVVAGDALATSQGCKNVVLRDGHLPEFVMHYLRASKAYAESLANGTTFLELSAAKLRTLAVPIPPPEEQEAIAVGLEWILTRIRASRLLLESVPGLVAIEGQELLARAYDGVLTERWRHQNSFAGSQGTAVRSLLASQIKNGLSVRGSEDPPGVRALRLSALRRRQVDLEDVRFLPISGTRAAPYLLSEGDVLVCRGNGTKNLVGRASLVAALSEPTIFPDTAFRLQFDKTRVSAEWFSLIWNAPQVRRQLEAAARTTAGIWKLRQGDVTDVELPTPPLAEQIEVVRLIGRALAQLDLAALSAAAALEYLNRLQASVLSLAFRGKLAKDLLERRGLVTLAEFRTDALAALKDVTHADLGSKREGPVLMTRSAKSRLDPDVIGKAYLAALIGGQAVMPAKLLFAMSDLSIADFYKQLAWEIDHGHLGERDGGFEAHL